MISAVKKGNIERLIKINLIAETDACEKIVGAVEKGDVDCNIYVTRRNGDLLRCFEFSAGSMWLTFCPCCGKQLPEWIRISGETNEEHKAVARIKATGQIDYAGDPALVYTLRNNKNGLEVKLAKWANRIDSNYIYLFWHADVDLCSAYDNPHANMDADQYCLEEFALMGD